MASRAALVFSLVVILLKTAISGCAVEGSDAETKSVVLEESSEVFANPYKGFAPWTGTVNPIYETTLSKATISWRQVNPAPGEFSWESFEAGWPEAGAGKRVGFRIAAAYPGREMIGIPDWLVEQGVRMSPYEIDEKEGLAPDWDDPRFLEAHRALITEMGSRYNDDPRVGGVEIGSYGFWGEWHVWRNEHLAGTEETKRAIIDHYLDAFPDKPLVIAFDDDFATRYVIERGGGIRNDCLGRTNSNNWFLESINRIDPEILETAWQRAMMTGEFCGSARGAIEGTTIRYDTTLAFVRQTHLSFIGPAGGAIEPRSEQHRADLDELHRTLGYRFVLREVSLPKSIRTGTSAMATLSLENVGVAPFYFAWPVDVTLHSDGGEIVASVRQDLDIREWLPGSHEVTLMVPGSTSSDAASLDLRIAIIDPATGGPGIRFANLGSDAEGRVSLGTIAFNR
jgi:hypothetical protein